VNNNNIVFDTNSLISALLIPSSISRKALDKGLATGNLLFSEETLSELNKVLLRSKFDKYIRLDERMEFIERLETEGTFIKPQSSFTDCRDAEDNKFLNLAYDSNALCIVTGDDDLLVLSPFRSIQIITPANFLNNFDL
jgi:putative PIN family toxin of toxin-antitoxin system